MSDNFKINSLCLALWLAHFANPEVPAGALPFAPLGPVLQWLTDNGRNIGLIVVVILMAITTAKGSKQKAVAPTTPIILIFTLNAIIILKTALLGDYIFSIQAISVLFVATFFIGHVAPQRLAQRNISHWQYEFRNLDFVTEIIFRTAILVVFTNLYVYLFNPDSSINYSNRLHGVTANPQHLAMTLALLSPSICSHLIKTEKKNKRIQIVILLGLVYFLCLLTASRMGILCLILGSMTFLWGTIKRLNAMIAFASISVCIVGFLSVGDVISQFYVERFVEGRDDTRSAIWQDAWLAFASSPFLGVNPEVQTGRVRYVESFWLSAAMNAGLIGLVCVIFIIISSLSRAFVWLRSSRRENDSVYAEKQIIFATAIFVIMSMATFESSLFGIFSTYTLISLLYLGVQPTTQIEGHSDISRNRSKIAI